MTNIDKPIFISAFIFHKDIGSAWKQCSKSATFVQDFKCRRSFLFDLIFDL